MKPQGCIVLVRLRVLNASLQHFSNTVRHSIKPSRYHIIPETMKNRIRNTIQLMTHDLIPSRPIDLYHLLAQKRPPLLARHGLDINSNSRLPRNQLIPQ